MTTAQYTNKRAAVAAAMTHLKAFNLDEVWVQGYPNNSPGPIWMVRHHKPVDNFVGITQQTVRRWGKEYGRAL